MRLKQLENSTKLLRLSEHAEHHCEMEEEDYWCTVLAGKLFPYFCCDMIML